VVVSLQWQAPLPPLRGKRRRSAAAGDQRASQPGADGGRSGGHHGKRNRIHHGAHLLHGAAAGVTHGYQPVGNGLGQDGLHVIGCHIVAPAEQRLGLGRTHERNACARAIRPCKNHLPERVASNQVLHVVQQGVGGVHRQHLAAVRPVRAV
jgi:hypothetical protein